MSAHPVHLALFLDIPLAVWERLGTFERETALYRRMQEKGARVTLVTTGDRSDLRFAERLPGMRILCNWAGLSEQRYIYRQHQLHWLRLRACNLLKIDQLTAGVQGVKAARLLKTPLIARSGYSWTYNLAAMRFDQKYPQQFNLYRRIEDDALRQATRVATDSDELRQHYIARAPSVASKAVLLPKYVDTDYFKPIDAPKRYDLVYIGRLRLIKNVFALLEAVRRTGASIAMVGGGPADDALWLQFGDLDGKIDWVGQVKHREILDYLAASRAFILPSFFEGQPKVVVEAMAAGLPVIGTNVFGTRAAIEHGQTGYLCETDVDSLAAAIRAVLDSPDLRRKLGSNARKVALERNSLDRLVDREWDLYQEILEERRAGQ